MHGIVFSFLKPNMFLRIGGMALTRKFISHQDVDNLFCLFMEEKYIEVLSEFRTKGNQNDKKILCFVQI